MRCLRRPRATGIATATQRRCEARSAHIARAWPRSGSNSGPMGPKWSPGQVTRMRPLAALARPARTARSVVKASSGLQRRMRNALRYIAFAGCTIDSRL